MSTNTSTLLKDSFTLGYSAGRQQAAQGRGADVASVRELAGAVQSTCSCKMSRRVPKFIARSYRLGFHAGYADLFAAETLARECESDGKVAHIEDASAKRAARLAEERAV